MLTKIRACASTLLLAAFLAGCASPYQNLPVRTGTVTETQQSLRKVFQPSAGGAAAGAAVGVAVAGPVGVVVGSTLGGIAGALGGAAAGTMVGSDEPLANAVEGDHLAQSARWPASKTDSK